MSSMTNKPIPKEDIISRECRFVIPIDQGPTDLHLVKEKVYLKDDSTTKRVMLVEDYKRPYYVAKMNQRNYKQKKERAPLENLEERTVTRREQFFDLKRTLGMLWHKGHPNEVYGNPYVYGTDYEHSSYLKWQYQKKYDKFSPFDIAVFDIETDTLHGSNKTIIATLSYKDKVVTAVVKDFVKGIYDVKAELYKKFDFYLGDVKKQRKIEWELVFVDTAGQAIIEVFKRAHLWSPDIVAIWNINFDLPKILEDLKDEDIDAGQVLSDPLVPIESRYIKYHEGPLYRKKEDGSLTPMKPAQRWHWVEVPASFYFIDAMQVYYQIRKSGQDEPSYALDAILDKELGIRKLKFKEADHLKSNSIQWHNFLQKYFPLEYIIYNVFDCVSIEMLDERTYDLSITMPLALKTSHFKIYSSEPRRTWDKLYGFLIDRGYAPGTSANVTMPLDQKQVNRLDWISTLPAHLMLLKESKWYLEKGKFYTKIRTHCADSDISAAYPSNGVALNISRETTSKELLSIQGVPTLTRKIQGMNLSGGHANAVEFMHHLFNLPDLFELDKLYQEHYLGKSNML
nr:MAG TPA: DNA POLYMERASE [Caudoviricetes sp.]